MDNVDSIQTESKRDLEPKMIRLRSEPIYLYKTEERNAAPHFQRLRSEPINLNNFEQNYTEQKNDSKHTIRPPLKRNNYLSRDSH